MDLTNRVVENPLECDHELHRIEVVDIVVPVRWEASPAGNHEPNVRINVERMPFCPEICRAFVLVLRDICTDMLACQVPVKGHVLGGHLFIPE